jgi:hypothetical protein
LKLEVNFLCRFIAMATFPKCLPRVRIDTRSEGFYPLVSTMKDVVTAIVVLSLTSSPAVLAQANDRSGAPLFSRAAITAAVARSTQTGPVVPAGAAPQPGWASRHPVLIGTAIGAGIGAGLAGRSGGINLAIGTAVGAGAGALVTGLISTSNQAAGNYRASSAAGPSVSDISRIKQTVSRLGVGRVAIVATRDGATLRGRILRIDPDRFVVTLEDRSAARDIAYSDVTAVRGRGVSTGVKAGLAAGIAGGIVLGWLACYGAGGCGGVS